MNIIKTLFFLILLPCFSHSQRPFERIKVEKIKSGMKMEQWSGTHEIWGNQFIVVVKAKMPVYRLDLAFAKDSLITTSSFANRLNAVAAINGGFFDMKAGGSVSFLYADGKIIHENKPNVLSPESEMGANAIVIYNNGQSGILPTEGSLRIPNTNNVEDALVTGPLLIQNNQINLLQKRPFNDLKHPRSAVCITKKDIWLITADGRHKEAVGLSLNELSQFLSTCGCPDAINLDGGGSTTLFLNTKKLKGIVNHPSDNKKFDADGERPVANILYLRPNKK
jgi:exopolysaccharide biosynthesis protein